MGPKMRVLEGGWERGRSSLEAAYDHYRLELRGNLVSKNTLEHYDYLVRPLFDWLDLERPYARSFESVGMEVVRAYRAAVTERQRRDGRPLQPRTLLDSHKALLTLFGCRLAAGAASGLPEIGATRASPQHRFTRPGPMFENTPGTCCCGAQLLPS
jgi:hypothetical protein